MARSAPAAALLAALLLACSPQPPKEDTGGGGGTEDTSVEDALDAVEDGNGGTDIGFDFDLGGNTDAETHDDVPDATEVVDSKDVVDAVDAAQDSTSTGISCSPGVAYCVGDLIKTCDLSGQNYQAGGVDCAVGGQVCKGAICVDKQVCEPNAEYCDGGNPAKCNSAGTVGNKILDCGSDEVCFVSSSGKANCGPKVCEPAATICSGEILTTCNATGSAAEPGGTDCTKTDESCVLVDGKPACAKPSCGDGKVNQQQEECDLGADNGKLGKTCDDNCKASSGKCVSPADCQGLGGACIASYLCVAGQCLAIAKSVGSCNDGDACTLGDHCVQGLCVGVAGSCDDGDPCTLDGCDPASGCSHKAQSGIACSDGNDCTIGDSCAAGACQAGPNACECKSDADCVGYDDGDPCNGVMACLSGTCEPKPGSKISCDGGVCVRPESKSDTCKAAGGVFTGVVCVDPAGKSSAECKAKGGAWQGDGPCQKAACSPASAACIPVAAIDDKACDDGDACTAPDLCSAGKCGGAKADCDDANPCTDDSCDPEKGCLHGPISQTDGKPAPCDDADASTAGDKCVAGVCKGTAILDCSSDADCKNEQQEQNACNGKLVCDKAAGKCKLDLATVVTCDPALGSACAPVACDSADGKCKASELPKGTPCNDGDACTKADACEGGSCKGGAAPACDDGNPCTDDACNPALGCVSSPNASKCDDGQPCTKDDICKNGACSPGDDTCQCLQDSDCAAFGDGNKCKGTWFCSKLANKCIFDAKQAVICGKGACSDPKWANATDCASTGATWKPDSACQITACEASSGTCMATLAADGKPCNDGSPCTLGDACKGGDCTSVPNPCEDGNPCTGTECSPSHPGGCLLDSSKLEGKECQDGNSCTEGDVCAGGVCKGAKFVDCDDGKVCTADACLPGKGCVHPAGSGPCDDGDLCTENDKCDGVFGKCEAGTAKVCKDANACTDDGCEPKTGCDFKPNDKTCNNGDPCSFGDFCAVGLCKAGTPTDCDDDNACTADSCEKGTGCKHEHQDGSCDDGDACTDQDKCFKSQCTGAPKDCNDDNTCTNDACDNKVGCVYMPALGDCGLFATCGDTGDGKLACAFQNNDRLLISELHAGAPLVQTDDYVELHNATTLVVDLDGYLLQARDVASEKAEDWTTVQAFAKGQQLLPGGYLLVGGSATLFAGRKADVVAAGLKIRAQGGQIRIFDKAHSLEHDAVRWGGGCGAAATGAAPALPEAGSIERRADATSTATELSRDGKLWLAGNAYDTGDSGKDFVIRPTPEPQGAGFYEPACGGTCGGGKVCDFKSAGSDTCVDDTLCRYGCGGGQKCNAQLGGCVLEDGTALVLSEVVIGSKTSAGARLVELHNAGKAAIDISGFVLDRKPVEDGVSASWVQAITQVPAGVTLQPGAYYLIATKARAEEGGGADLLATLDLDPTGGTLRIRDPHTGVEFDRFGWGKSKTAAGAPLDVGGSLPAGLSMTRKASVTSNGLTMGPSGKEWLAGNAQNSKNNGADWLILLNASPRSWHGGTYGPACGGSCSSGQVCNYVRGAEACVDPTCGSQCGTAEVCNPKTGKCDNSILISQISVVGPEVASPKLLPTENEAVELYNPGDHLVPIGGTVLQYLAPGPGGWQTRTQIFPSGICVNNKNAPCLPGETCTCEGENNVPCSSDSACSGTYIAPRSRFLVVASKSDPVLPEADLVSTFTWAFNTVAGAVRFVRTSAKPFPSGDIASDKVAWGTGMKTGGFPNEMPSHSDQPLCSLRRRPWAEANACQMSDPSHAAYYGGAGHRTSDPAADFVVVCPRNYRNSGATPAGK
ncbi:MAG: lamin tail domain-containing protein [Deltaproteobacteria bacterium]|nr:lamin tail domain-containing protein [Deltaproteobacteria bacterium]